MGGVGHGARPGTASIEHLEENVAATLIELEPDEVRELSAL